MKSTPRYKIIVDKSGDVRFLKPLMDGEEKLFIFIMTKTGRLIERREFFDVDRCEYCVLINNDVFTFDELLQKGYRLGSEFTK